MDQLPDAPKTGHNATLQLFEAPSPFTALCFTLKGQLIAGAADGSIRLYDLSATAPRTLFKAIRGLPDEISSLCFSPVDESVGIGRVWAASGKQMFLFELDSDKLVIDHKDAKDVITLIEQGEGGEDNVLNGIAVSKDLVAFSCDSGAVGVWEAQTRTRKLMKAMHSNAPPDMRLSCVRFVISGGYDSQLIHFDAPLGSVLSKLDISLPPSTSSAISLSPPFILSIVVNSDGKLAAVTADGRLIIGRGGERARKDRGSKRKWKGLNPELIDQYHVAHGPVVGVSWVGRSEVMIVSLGGRVKLFQLPKSPTATRSKQLKPTWETHTNRIDKVNSLATYRTQEHVLHSAVGGLTPNGRGCLEIWAMQCGIDMAPV